MKTTLLEFERKKQYSSQARVLNGCWKVGQDKRIMPLRKQMG